MKEFFKTVGVIFWYMLFLLFMLIGVIVLEALFNGMSLEQIFTKFLPTILSM